MCFPRARAQASSVCRCGWRRWRRDLNVATLVCLAGLTPLRRQVAPSGVAHVYAHRCRHSLAHLYTKRSPQLGSWAERRGWWAGHVTMVAPPPLAWPARWTAADPHPAWPGLSPGRPEQASLQARMDPPKGGYSPWVGQGAAGEAAEPKDLK